MYVMRVDTQVNEKFSRIYNYINPMLVGQRRNNGSKWKSF